MRAGLLALALAAGAAGPLAAQDSLPPPIPDSAVVDSIRRPVSPMGAFWRSLVLPGWGQAANGRRVAGAIFLGVEGVALGMALKTSREVGQLEDAGSGLVDDKRQQREDWLIILAFNHLMSALEAFTAAHLWDFPGDLQVQRDPGGYRAGITLPLPTP